MQRGVADLGGVDDPMKDEAGEHGCADHEDEGRYHDGLQQHLVVIVELECKDLQQALKDVKPAVQEASGYSTHTHGHGAPEYKVRQQVRWYSKAKTWTTQRGHRMIRSSQGKPMPMGSATELAK